MEKMALLKRLWTKNQDWIIRCTTPQMEQGVKCEKTEIRKRATRFNATAVPALKKIAQVGGPKTKLINISRSGALIEGREYLLPGSSISLQITVDEAEHIIRGRIVRVRASSKSKREFQIAIAFDKDFTILPESIEEIDDNNFLK